MKTKTKFNIIMGAAVFAALCYAGRCDWEEDVIGKMPAEAYYEIKSKLGENCTNYQIAEEYVSNHSYYDTLCAY